MQVAPLSLLSVGGIFSLVPFHFMDFVLCHLNSYMTLIALDKV